MIGISLRYVMQMRWRDNIVRVLNFNFETSINADSIISVILLLRKLKIDWWRKYRLISSTQSDTIAIFSSIETADKANTIIATQLCFPHCFTDFYDDYWLRQKGGKAV